MDTKKVKAPFIPSQYFRNQMVSSVDVVLKKDSNGQVVDEVFIVDGIIGRRIYSGFTLAVQAKRKYMLDVTNTDPEVLGRLLG